jgi:TolA-binding protein
MEEFHGFEPREDSALPEISPFARRATPFVAAALLCATAIGYVVQEHRKAQDLAAENQQLTTRLSATHSQMDALMARVNALATSAPAAPVTAPAAEGKPSPAVHAGRVTDARRPVVHRRAVPDARFSKLQSQLDAQNKAIEDTRSDLAGARTELSSSIARTHGELVVLEKKGERNYTEFDVQKAKQFKREGPVSVKLKKANVKNQYADLQLIVDDHTLTQKHVNLDQPAMFYQPDTQQPVEIVINEISKDHIHGYISAPKYRQSELAAMSTPASGPDQTSNLTPPAARRRLPLAGDDGPVQ